MRITALLERLEVLLNQEQVLKDSPAEEEIQELVSDIFEHLPYVDYDESRQIRFRLFDISERHHELFWACLFISLDRQLISISNLPSVVVAEKFESKGDLEYASDYLLHLLETFVGPNTGYRLSDTLIPPTEIPEGLQYDLLSLVIKVLQYDRTPIKLGSADIRELIYLLPIARQFALLINNPDIFYALVIFVINKLNAYQDYQLCRDFAEEVLSTSYIDDKREWGYLALFLAFNGQFNVNMAFLYANVCVASIRRSQIAPDLIMKRLLVSLQRLYRNILFFERADAVYTYMLKDLKLDAYDHFDITNTHFLTQIFKQNSSVVHSTYEYIVINAEFIFRTGKSIALPLLNTIYNMKCVFSSHNDIVLLDPYLNILESIVGKEDAKRFRTLAYGDSYHLKDLFIEALVSLQSTRSRDDLVYDVHNALIVAERLVKFSFDNQDAESFLLGMILKEDHSWVFPEKSLTGDNPIVKVLPEEIPDESLKHYQDYSKTIQTNLQIGEEDGYLWLAEAQGQIYSLMFQCQTFSGIQLVQNWQTKMMHDWFDKSIRYLTFDETIIRRGQIEQYLEDDQLQDLEQVKAAVHFAKVDTEQCQSLLLARDMELARFPHNLILNSSGDFISRKMPITGLPSTEWFIMNQRTGKNLGADFSKSLWLPTEHGDFALNLLWSKLSDSADKYGIIVSNSLLPDSPLSADVNILCAHGETDISLFPALFAGEDVAVINLDPLIGCGTIVLLFICHSGSMRTGFYRRKLLSLIREFFERGYQAVIAPFWSLHISIPPIWLPEFFSSLTNNLTISQAVFNANSKIYDANKNPGAWACLHLYGNPYLRVD